MMLVAFYKLCGMGTMESMRNKKTIFGWIAVFAVIGGLFYSTTFLQRSPYDPGVLDQFAICLKDKGALFYGAFWCSHCQSQKKLFGGAQDKLPYIECSTPDGKGLLPVCKDAKIEGYPTWVFADGSRESGELDLSRLAEKTGCELPKETGASSVASSTETVNQ
jgi:thiol-disulfide isomerase/thioredoxin